MNEAELEELLGAYEGPEPRPETRAAVLRAAQGVRAGPAPAATVSLIARAPGHQRRWPRAALASAAAVLLGSALLWLLTTHYRSRQVGRALGGGLAVNRSGDPVTVCKDGPLFAGDRVSAPDGGAIELADGSTVRLDRSTELALAEPRAGERARLDLGGGRVFLRVAEAPGEFTVSGSALVRVLGTIFGVEERGGRTSVGVLSGRVALSSAGSDLRLERGESGSAEAGRPPETIAADPNEMLKWAREPVSFRDRPLSEVLDWIGDNSTYRFEITTVRSMERTVTVTVRDESMREVIEKLLGDCKLNYEFDGDCVRIQ